MLTLKWLETSHKNAITFHCSTTIIKLVVTFRTSTEQIKRANMTGRILYRITERFYRFLELLQV